MILLTTVRDFYITIIFPKEGGGGHATVEKLLSPGLQLANNYHHITWKWYYTKKKLQITGKKIDFYEHLKMLS